MNNSESLLAYKGSLRRCLAATSLPRSETRHFIQQLVQSHAEIPDEAQWMPKGFLDPGETELVKDSTFLTQSQRSELENWWLAIPGKRIPNWDLVAECAINGTSGLVLVEAKAHEGEFHEAHDSSGSKGKNAESIRKALAEAEDGLNELESGFSLSADSHFQLCNRFAFAWKLASMGIPTVLIYLGFLDAEEMDETGNVLLRSPEQWSDCVKRKSFDRIPESAWERTYMVNGTPMTVLIRSARISVSCAVA